MSDRLEEILSSFYAQIEKASADLDRLNIGLVEYKAAENQALREAKQALQSYIDSKIIEARIETAEMALRACPTKDNMLREWLKQHIVAIKALNHRKERYEQV